MNRIQHALAIGALALSAMPVHASITVGAMARQDGSTVIEDSLNNRQ